MEQKVLMIKADIKIARHTQEMATIKPLLKYTVSFRIKASRRLVGKAPYFYTLSSSQPTGKK